MLVGQWYETGSLSTMIESMCIVRSDPFIHPSTRKLPRSYIDFKCMGSTLVVEVRLILIVLILANRLGMSKRKVNFSRGNV